MVIQKYVGVVKMAIISNPNLDNKTCTSLCQYMDDLKVLIDNQDSLIKTLRELNNNQAILIANNRTKRSDYNA